MDKMGKQFQEHWQMRKVQEQMDKIELQVIIGFPSSDYY
jgi:hypothetical protein